MICLIDLSAIFAQSWHAAGPEAQGAGYDGTLTAINRIANANPRNVAICCDSPTNWRKVLEPSYKAQREKAPATYYEQLTRVKQRLVRDGYLLWTCEGYEADDVIATATDAALEAGHEVLIATSDKDLLQLVADKVHVLRTHTWETWDIPKVVEKFGVQPARLGMWLALVGDKADNVPGCPLVGPKVATSLVTDYPSWPALWEAVNTPPGVMPTAAGKQSAVGLNLRTYKTQVELAAKLVALRFDAPIEFKEIFAERTVVLPATEPGGDDMPHDLGAIHDAIEEKAAEMAKPDPSVNHNHEPVYRAQEVAVSPVVLPAPASVGVLTPQQVLNPMPAPVTALAKPSAPDLGAMFGSDMRPTKMDGCWWLARRLFESNLYKRFPNAEAILAVMLTGLELGLNPMEAVAPGTFHIIQGAPCPGAHLLIAKAMRSPDCEYFQLLESTEETCTYVTKHRKHPEPTKLTLTRVEALKAPGLNMAQWNGRPALMLRKMTGVQLARIVYPGELAGLYAQEEME